MRFLLGSLPTSASTDILARVEMVPEKVLPQWKIVCSVQWNGLHQRFTHRLDNVFRMVMKSRLWSLFGCCWSRLSYLGNSYRAPLFQDSIFPTMKLDSVSRRTCLAHTPDKCAMLALLPSCISWTGIPHQYDTVLLSFCRSWYP